MSSQWLGEMFESVSADICTGKFPLMSMGDRAEGLACADPEVRTPTLLYFKKLSIDYGNSQVIGYAIDIEIPIVIVLGFINGYSLAMQLAMLVKLSLLMTLAMELALILAMELDIT